MTTNRPVVLIVDDEADIRELISMTLARMEITCIEAETVAEAKKALKEQPFQLCLTDMRLPDSNGLELIRFITQEYPQTPVAMITAHGNMDLAIDSLKAGAFDFVNKPIELSNLKELVSSALKLEPLAVEQSEYRDKSTPLKFLGESPPVIHLLQTIKKLARSQAPIFIQGESGTGKELVARLIHHQGPRSDHPFVAVNCGAIPADLIESELFGHIKGSFTGAHTNKVGLFQIAHGGTLFLDEIADLPLEMQVKLLRVIQEKVVRPIGATKEERIDVRILSATHQILEDKIRQGRFREDLFFRIHVIALEVPPLRERSEDLPLLVKHITQRICENLEISNLHFTKEAIKALTHYTFPGNVRELENILERAVTLAEGDYIDAEDLNLPHPFELTETGDNFNPKHDNLDHYLEQIERTILTKALERCRFNKTAAAKELGISFRSMRYRLKRLEID